MIRLFDANATVFDTNGLGNLSDAVSCVVVEERNGEFELEMEYPVNGIHYKDLGLRKIIFVKPNPYDEPQAFRIYSISSPINFIVTVSAEHISYDLSGIPASPFTATMASAALAELERFTKEDGYTPFTFGLGPDKTNVEATMSVTEPKSVRSLLGGTDGSILDVYRGEFSFNNFAVTLHNNRGTNNGTTISYGKNLTSFKQDENCNRVYTGVYPYWKGYVDDSEVLITLPEKVVNVEGTFDFKRVLPLNLSTTYEEAPSEEQIRNAAKSYISNNHIGVPKVSLKVKFIPLSQTDEYEKYVSLERIRLCDYVTIRFPKINVDATAECVKTEYDAISDRYISIELGDSYSNLSQTISNQSTELNSAIDNIISIVPSHSQVNAAINKATDFIRGGSGGYVFIRSTSDRNTPDEIVITTTPDPLDEDGISPTSQIVWRWNKNGFGVSRDYGHTYEGAIIMDPASGAIINANYITAGTLSADRLKGTITADSDVVIKWGAVDDAPTIPSKTSQLTNDSKYQTDANVRTLATSITKDTVTTSYVNALNVKAGSVDAENITGTYISGKKFLSGRTNQHLDPPLYVGQGGMELDDGDLIFYRTGESIGRMSIHKYNGYSGGHNNNAYGIVLDADYDAQFISLGMQETNGGNWAIRILINQVGDSGRFDPGDIYQNIHFYGSTFFSGNVNFQQMVGFRTCMYGGLPSLWIAPHSESTPDLYGIKSSLWVSGHIGCSGDLEGNLATGSDRRIKHDIEDLDDRYITLFDNLKPKRFKLNRSSDEVYHLGYIAQDVEKAVKDSGLEDNEFGAIVNKGEYSLRYTEMAIMYDMKIRQLEDRISKLEELLNGNNKSE